MAECNGQASGNGNVDQAERGDAPLPALDTRKPYEAPRLLKKRSVARATLFTVVGTAGGTLVTHG